MYWDQGCVEIIAAKVGIAVGCQNFDNTVADLDDGYIESTAAKVVYHDLLLMPRCPDRMPVQLRSAR